MTSGAQRLDELRRAALENRVRAGSLRAAEEPPRTTQSGPLPLSVSQNQLWYLQQLAPESGAYNELIEIRKRGALDASAARRALIEVVRRHDALRTTFDDIEGVPHQFVNPPTEIDVPLVDLSHLEPAEAERQAFDIVAADTAVAYDLARGPLLRARIIRVSGDDHRLYLGMPHLIFDGVTLYNVVFPEFIACYRSYSLGQPPSLPEPEAQYADYTEWERDWVAGPQVAARIDRWRDRLADVTPTLPPTDRPLPAGHRFAGAAVPVALERRTVEGLRRIGRRAGGTLFHALAAAYAWWLHSYTESTDVVFGTPHDLRYRKDLLTVAGYCVTPLVVRCAVIPEEPFTALVERIRYVVTDAVSDAVPFETLIGELAIPRDPRNNPLFQAALLLRPPVTSKGEEWSVRLVEREVIHKVASTKFDISMHLDERPEGHLTGGLFFSTDLFDPATAREMARCWVRLLDAVADAPDMPMSDHDLVTDDDRRRQLGWNPRAPEDISSACVHELVRAQAERTPDAVAVQVGDRSLTYRRLDARANAIGAQLRTAGVRRGAVVATLLGRTPDLVATLLGILKCGAAFLPLDPGQPAARNDFCIKETGATVVVTEALLRELRAAGDAEPEVVSLDDLAYIIYTSGSTGRPKGVLIEHGNLTSLMQTMYRRFGVTDADTVLSVSATSFDLAIGDIFCTLACGARLVLATREQMMNPIAVGRLISAVGATYMMATPTMWGALVASGWSGEPRLTAATAGETLSDTLAGELQERCRAVWNCWGPTETTIINGGARLDPGDRNTLGTPLPGVRVYVLDRQRRMQPVGLPGEVAIGGPWVARGYLDRPEEQARRFVDDPFVAGGRLYLTGDRGRFLADGRLQHLGRYDDQVKIRGFRIEPAEIEARLCEHPEVKASAVVARDAPNGDRYLVAYVVDESGRLEDHELRDWLRRRLPEHMVPGAFVHLAELPKTARGKLDRAALPAPSRLRSVQSEDERPRNDAERRVAALWAELLGEPVADVNTDFFDVGGHSLLAVRLIFEMHRRFGVELSLPAFLDSGRTVAALAALVASPGAGDRRDLDEANPPLHFVFPDVACAMAARHFAAQWGVEQPVHALKLVAPDEPLDPSQEIQRLAAEVREAIRERQPSGPYALAGFSLGAIVAYELARQLVDAGEEVGWLGIFDTPAPPLMQLMRTTWGRLRRMLRRPPREQWVKYRVVGKRILREGVATLSVRREPPDVAQSVAKQYDIQSAREIICSYDKPGHTVPLHLFVTEGSASQSDAHLLGWDGYHAGPLAVDRFPGDHVAFLDRPRVVDVAQAVLESLRGVPAYRRKA